MANELNACTTDKSAVSDLSSAFSFGHSQEGSSLYIDAYKDCPTARVKDRIIGKIDEWNGDAPSEGLIIGKDWPIGKIDPWPGDAPLEGTPKVEDWASDSMRLSDKDRSDAVAAMEKGVSKLIPEADREIVKSLIMAIASGDEKACGEALKKVGNDPEKLKKITEEVNNAMDRNTCGTKLHVTANGHVLIEDGFSGSAPSFDPLTGKVEVKDVEHRMDGSIRVRPDEVLNADAHKLFSNISDRLVSHIYLDQHFQNRLETLDMSNAHPLPSERRDLTRPRTQEQFILKYEGH